MVTQDPVETPFEAPLEEVAVVEQPKAPVQAAQPTSGETVEDVQAQIARLTQENAKLVNDLRSQQVGIMRQKERDDLLREVPGIRDELAVLHRTNAALLRALGKGETEALPEELERIESEATQRSAARSFDERAARLYAQLEEAVAGEDGTPLFNLREPSEAGGLWTKGMAEHDLGLLAEAVTTVHREVRRIEKQRAQDSRAKEQARQSGAPRPRPVPGTNDLATPKPAGGAIEFRTTDDMVDAFLQGKITMQQITTRLTDDQKQDLRSRYGITVQ